jgi:transcription initiation factor TFIIF subunit alpha
LASKRGPATTNGRASREPSTGPGSAENEKKLKDLEDRRKANGGWGDPNPPDTEAKEYKLVTTKRELLNGIRYHIMRFNRPQEDPVDPTNQDQFPRPVMLHRRNAQQNPGEKAMQKEEMEPSNPVDDAENERLRQQKADREAQRALEQAQIATVLKNNEPRRQNKRPKLTTFYKKDSDEHKKQQQLHYEETMPWHLEDVESKNVWVGSYIAALSDVNCALVIDGGAFRMIPLQRYYKFDEKPNFHTLTLDEAEKAMKEEFKMTRWMMADKQSMEAKREEEETRAFLGGRPRVKTESSTSRAVPKSERADDYDIDMEGDEFQDDDEAPGFDADDEDTRDTKDRVRREQLGANMFGEGDEEEVDKEREEEEKERQRRKELGKDTRKGLKKHENALEYASEDSDDGDNENNPFTDPSVSSKPRIAWSLLTTV